MNNAAAVAGSLIDVKNVNTHKVVRLSIDVPAEQAAAVLGAFGWPTAVNPIPVAIARLVAVPESATPVEKPKRAWDDLAPAQQAGIRCGELRFLKFLVDEGVGHDDETPEEMVRRHCRVKSRADIKTGTVAAQLWSDLERGFQMWLLEPTA